MNDWADDSQTTATFHILPLIPHLPHYYDTHTGSYQTVIRWQFWLVITWSDTNAWHSCNYSLLNSSSMINMSSLSSFLITTRQDDLTYSYQYYLTIFNLWQQNKVIVVNGKSGKSWGAIIMNVVLICLIFKHVSTQLPSPHLISTFPPLISRHTFPVPPQYQQ